MDRSGGKIAEGSRLALSSHPAVRSLGVPPLLRGAAAQERLSVRLLGRDEQLLPSAEHQRCRQISCDGVLLLSRTVTLQKFLAKISLLSSMPLATNGCMHVRRHVRRGWNA